MKIKKTIICLFLSTMILITGCGSSTEEVPEAETATINVEQNTWSGGVGRIIKLQTQAINAISVIEEYNNYIIKNNPEDYWSDAYFYIGTTPINSDWLPWTYYLTEDIDEATMLSYITGAYPNVFGAENIYRPAKVVKVEKNHYNLNWQAYEEHPILDSRTYIDHTIDCTYDAMHNRMRGTYTLTDELGDSQYLYSFYEYAEIDSHTFAVQTDTDRLFVRLDDDGNVSQMYYSVLSPTQNRAGYDEDEVDINSWYKTWWVDWEVEVEEPEEEIYYKYPSRYNYIDDSIFYNTEEISPDWVMEEPTVGQYIIYENGTLTALMSNILTGDMEGFSLKKNVSSSLPEGVQTEGNTDTMALPPADPTASPESTDVSQSTEETQSETEPSENDTSESPEEQTSE